MLENLASYAVDPKNSKGRLYNDYALYYRNQFQRDTNRITASTSFRRLKHKTQVFTSNKGDHYRTRLTHSLEVAQIGRTIAQALSLSTDLVEVLCLAHDLGHPPFGHKGEKALNTMLKEYGGFNHNVHTLKLVTKLEEKYIEFNGLNLTWETLEGLAKHNGPLIGKNSRKVKYSLDYILEYNDKHDLQLDKFSSLEAQVASIADDIAYNCHDIDDALNAEFFSLNDLRQSGICNDIIDEVMNIAGSKEKGRIIYEIIRRIKNYLIEDIVVNSRKNILKSKIQCLYDVQNYNSNIIDFSSEGYRLLNRIVEFLFKNLHSAEEVIKMSAESEKIVTCLYKHYINNPGMLPGEWHRKVSDKKQDLPIIVADYIAGMTDIFACEIYKKL